MIDTIADSLNLKNVVIEEFLSTEKNFEALCDFFEATGPKKILVYY